MVFPIQLALLVALFLQDSQEEPNDLIIRMNQLVVLEETWSRVNQRLTEYQEKMKDLFDQNTKGKEMQVRDLVLR